MHTAILTFPGFNELDSLIALGVLNRIKQPGWRVSLCCPQAEVTSMNGVTLRAQGTLEDAAQADAVIVGSGVLTREVVADAALMARLRLDPARQLIGAQCSGTLILAKLGLVAGVPACTDLTTKPRSVGGRNPGPRRGELRPGARRVRGAGWVPATSTQRGARPQIAPARRVGPAFRPMRRCNAGPGGQPGLRVAPCLGLNARPTRAWISAAHAPRCKKPGWRC